MNTPLKRTGTVIAALLAFGGVAYPQMQLDWMTTWGGVGDELTAWFDQEPGGDVVAVGFATGPGIIGSDLLYLRFQSDGSLVTAQRMNAGSDETIEGFDMDASGAIVSSGEIGADDALIFGLDPGGAVSWATRWDAGPGSEDHLDSLSIDEVNSRVFAAGGTGVFAQDVLLLVFDGSGALQHSLAWDTGTSESINGTALYHEGGGDVSFYAVGNFNTGSAFDALVMKFDVSPSLSTPTLEWARRWGGAGGDDAFACAVDESTGDLYVVGATEGSFVSGTDEDVFVLKVDPNGNVLWDITWGSTGDESPVVQVIDGRVFLTGSSETIGVAGGATEAFLIELDPADGTVEWGRTWGGCFEDFFALAGSASGWYALGVTTSYEGTFHSCDCGLYRTVVNGNWVPEIGTLTTVSGNVSMPSFAFSNAPTNPGTGFDVLLLHLVEQEIGENYCMADTNTTCSPATMSATGSTSIAANDLCLRARLVPNDNGIFFYGPGQQSVPFGNGTLCVTTPIGRLDVVTATGNELNYCVDFTMPPSAATEITAGSTWNFQAWFRDPNVGANFDLSDGLSVSFVP